MIRGNGRFHPDAALIELHDARLKTVTIGSDGSLTIKFDALSRYRQVAPDHYEIWLYPAALKLSKVIKVEMAWSVALSAHIGDAVVLDGSSELDWKELFEERAVSHLQLTFTSGSTLAVDCATAILTVEEPGTYLEDWLGPL